MEIKEDSKHVVMCHYPIPCFRAGFAENSYMLYGHVHNTRDELLVNHFQKITRENNIPCNMINCFCKFSDYKPLSLDEWFELDTKRRNTL